MIKVFNAEKELKLVRTIMLVVGGYYFFMSAGAIAVVYFQRTMMGFKTDASDFSHVFTTIQSVMLKAMPWLACIGLAYLIIAGLMYKNLSKKLLVINIVLAILTLIWLVFYFYNLIDYFKIFEKLLTPVPKTFKVFFNISIAFSVLQSLLFFAAPQAFIFYKLRQLQKVNAADNISI